MDYNTKTEIIMNKDEIKQFLPHREPMLLIDEAFIDDKGMAHAKYLIKEDEFFTRGHFPGEPIVPGVIQCEIMAQSCAIMVKDEIPGHITLYAGIDKVRFKNIVRPGDLCEVTAQLERRRSTLCIFTAKLEVNGKLCSKGELTFASIPLEINEK